MSRKRKLLLLAIFIFASPVVLIFISRSWIQNTTNGKTYSDMKNALVRLGIPPNKIYCDYAGFSTFDSIIRAKEIFQLQSFTIISQEFHNRRAIFIGNALGLQIIGMNATEVTAYHSFKTKCREQLAKVKTVMDLYLIKRKPRFLGEKITIT